MSKRLRYILVMVDDNLGHLGTSLKCPKLP